MTNSNENQDMAIEEMYLRLMGHAKRNYNMGGWDNFVECVGLEDFKQDAHDFNLRDFADAFAHFSEWCRLKKEQMEEVRAYVDYREWDDRISDE